MLKFIGDIQAKLNITKSQFAKLLGLKDLTALRAMTKAKHGMSLSKLIALYKASGDTPAQFLERIEREISKQ